MGIEKHGSKGGNYVGGFLQLFDWNAKSRKKLFTSKSDVPEQSKHKKRCDGSFPVTRLQMLDEDEIRTEPSIKDCSDYSCGSSVNDEEIYRTKAPGVVARLMGLDSLPESRIQELYASSPFETQSLPDVHSRTRNLEYRQDLQIMHSSKEQKIHRPIEKFQTEILPPKSAKSIPITHHKLLSPIKSVNSIPPKNAAQIMEAAAKIIERRPEAGKKTKLPLVGASSVPLKVRDLKEKVQKAGKISKISEVSRSEGESKALKILSGNSMNKSWNGSTDVISVGNSPGSQELSDAVKSRGKSISLALQAKANVQKRSLNLVSQKEKSELNTNEPFKSQATTQKSTVKRPFTQNSSNVLRQNNQKQNCIIDRGKPPLKSNLQSGKILNGDSSSARLRNTSKASKTSKLSSRKLGSEVKDDKREVVSSSSEKATRKKRSFDGSYHSEKDQGIAENGKGLESSVIMDSKNSWENYSEREGNDVISFTFTAPLTRSRFGTGSLENYNIVSADSQSKRTLLRSDGMSASRFSYLEHKFRGSDGLSTLLEQTLKELTHEVEFSKQKKRSVLHDVVPELNALMSSTMPEENKSKDGQCMNNQVKFSEQKKRSILHDVVPELNALMSSTMSEENKTKDGRCMDNQDMVDEMEICDSSISQARTYLDYRLPSPISVFEHSFAESCNSTGVVDSNSTGGSKQSSSIQTHEVLGTNSLSTLLSNERYADLSDSASSTSAKSIKKIRETTLTLSEQEYVKDILCNIEPMFKDYALGRTREIVYPRLFNQLESQKGHFCQTLLVPSINRRVLFDSVSECMDLRCKRYVSGGYNLWNKGLSVIRRKESLAEEVYREILSWSATGDSMVDELVDKDMSSRYGKWLDFEIEAFELGMEIESRILNSLINEVVADILVL